MRIWPFTLTIALSAWLLFAIQPLAAKALLPHFGGAPAVWTTCMVFFQGLLLVGYAYAHYGVQRLQRIPQRFLHVALMALSFLFLPILWTHLPQPQLASPIIDVFLLLLTKLGLPVLILCANAPLLQHWFSQTSHQHADDPYFLYAASNAGSLIALLCVPLILEPLWDLKQLSWLWSVSYAVFVIFLLLIATRSHHTEQPSTPPASTAAPTIKKRFYWLLLSFAPSSLLLGVTQHITTDIAAMPLLWILPLLLYLTTFIIVFSRNPIISQSWLVRNYAIILVFPLLDIALLGLKLPAWLLILFHLAGFFILALICHGQLAAERPSKHFLTRFYLWIAIGGFCGGIFNGLIAPTLFNHVYEYYIALCLCILLVPTPSHRYHYTDLLFPVLVAMVLIAGAFLLPPYRFAIGTSVDLFSLAVLIMILFFSTRPMRFALSLSFLFIYTLTAPNLVGTHLIWQSRNFFGVKRVYAYENLHILLSGTTVHGAQLLGTQTNRRPMTYYTLVEKTVDLLPPKKERHIGIAGLGTGSLSCQFRPLDKVTFFEIDPEMIDIARNPALFEYLSLCPAQTKLGDARLLLQQAPAAFFDVIIIDAFSSDAIPTHLLTREALQLYWDKLSPSGLLLFNISNRHIDLRTVLATHAIQENAHALYKLTSAQTQQFIFSSLWVTLVQDPLLAARLRKQGWQDIKTTHPVLWTDQFSNILSALTYHF